MCAIKENTPSTYHSSPWKNFSLHVILCLLSPVEKTYQYKPAFVLLQANALKDCTQGRSNHPSQDGRQFGLHFYFTDVVLQ